MFSGVSRVGTGASLYRSKPSGGMWGSIARHVIRTMVQPEDDTTGRLQRDQSSGAKPRWVSLGEVDTASRSSSRPRVRGEEEVEEG